MYYQRGIGPLVIILSSILWACNGQTENGEDQEQDRDQDQHELTILVEGSGTVSPSEGAHYYDDGTTVDLVATPASGWSFESWSGDVANSHVAQTSIFMDADKTVTAHFQTMGGGEGTQLWRFETGRGHSFGGHYSSPALDLEGTIYIGGYDGNLYAVNPDGSLKWSFDTGGHIESSPALADNGTVYVGNNDGFVFAVNPDGTEMWRFETGRDVISSPAIGPDGVIYVGSNDGNLYALNADGTKRWKYDAGSWVVSSPMIHGGVIYVGSWNNNTFHAVSSNGEELWTLEVNDAIYYSSPAIGPDGTIFVGSRDNHLYAISPSGTILWSFETGDSVDSSPSIAEDGTIYVGSRDGHLYAVSQAGEEIFRVTVGDRCDSSPAISADGTLYVGGGFQVHAIAPDGEVRWSFDTEWFVRSSPTIAPDGTVYVAGNDGFLYAIEGGGSGLATGGWPKFRGDERNTGSGVYAEED